MAIPPDFRFIPVRDTPPVRVTFSTCLPTPIAQLAARCLSFDLLEEYNPLNYESFEKRFIDNLKDYKFHLPKLKDYTTLPGFEGDKIRGIPRVLALILMKADLKTIDRSNLKEYLDTRFAGVHLPILWNLITQSPSKLKYNDADYLLLLDKIIEILPCTDIHLFYLPLARMYKYLSTSKLDYLHRIGELDPSFQSKIFQNVPPEFGQPYFYCEREWVVIDENIPKPYVNALSFLPFTGIKRIQIKLSQDEKVADYSEPSTALGKRHATADTRTKKQSRQEISFLLSQLKTPIEEIDLRDIRHLNYQELYTLLASLPHLRSIGFNPLNSHLDALLGLDQLEEFNLYLPYHERNSPGYVQNLQGLLSKIPEELQLNYDTTDEWTIVDLIPILQLYPKYCPRAVVSSDELTSLAVYVPKLEQLSIHRDAKLENFPFFPSLRILEIQDGSRYDFKSFEAEYTGKEFNIRIESLDAFSNLLVEGRDPFVLNSLLKNIRNNELFFLGMANKKLIHSLVQSLAAHPEYVHLARFLLVQYFATQLQLSVSELQIILYATRNYEHCETFEDILLTAYDEQKRPDFIELTKESNPLLFLHFAPKQKINEKVIQHAIQQLQSFDLDYSTQLCSLMPYIDIRMSASTVKAIARLFYNLHIKYDATFILDHADKLIHYLMYTSSQDELENILEITFKHAPEHFVGDTFNTLRNSVHQSLALKTMVESQTFNLNIATTFIYKIIEIPHFHEIELEYIESLFKSHMHKFEFSSIKNINSPKLAILMGQLLAESEQPLNFAFVLSVILKLCLEEVEIGLTANLLLKLTKGTLPYYTTLLKCIKNPLVAIKVVKAIVNNPSLYKVFYFYLSDLLASVENDDALFSFIENSPTAFKFQPTMLPIISASLPKLLAKARDQTFNNRHHECLQFLVKSNYSLDKVQQQIYFDLKKKLPLDKCANLVETEEFLIKNPEYFFKWLEYLRSGFGNTEKISDLNLTNLLVSSYQHFEQLPEISRDKTIKHIFKILYERRTNISTDVALKILPHLSKSLFHWRVFNFLSPLLLDDAFISALKTDQKEFVAFFLSQAYINKDIRLDKTLLNFKLENHPETLDFVIENIIKNYRFIPDPLLQFAIEYGLLENPDCCPVILKKLTTLELTEQDWDQIESITPFASFKILLNSLTLPKKYLRKIYTTEFTHTCFAAPLNIGSLVDVTVTESQQLIPLDNLYHLFESIEFIDFTSQYYMDSDLFPGMSRSILLSNVRTFIDEIRNNRGVLGVPGNHSERQMYYVNIKKALQVIIDYLQKQPFSQGEFCLVTLAEGLNSCGTGKLNAVKACYSYVTGESVGEDQLSVKEKLVQHFYQMRLSIFDKFWIECQPTLVQDDVSYEVHYYLLLRELAEKSLLKLPKEVPYEDKVVNIPNSLKKLFDIRVRAEFSPKKFVDVLTANNPFQYEDLYECLVEYYFKKHTSQSYHPGNPIPEVVSQALSNAFDTESTGSITKNGLMDLLISQGFLLIF